MVNSGEVWIVHEGVGVSVSLELGRGGDMVLSLCHQTGRVAEEKGVSISSLMGVGRSTAWSLLHESKFNPLSGTATP